MSGSRIFLQHEYAAAFFDRALNPDLEELRCRDVFLSDLAQTCPYWREGTDLVSEIPDIDIAALCRRQIMEYECKHVLSSTYKLTMTEDEMCYSIKQSLDVAA